MTTALYYLASIDVGELTYYHWFRFPDFRDLDHPDASGAGTASATHTAVVYSELVDALPRSRTTHQTPDDEQKEIKRALGHRFWVDPEHNRATLTELAAQVLPARLREELAEPRTRQGRLKLLLGPSQRWARIPWELLPVGGRRLLDVADICGTVPAPLLDDRARQPRTTQGPGLYVIDPLNTLRRLLDAPRRRDWNNRAKRSGCTLIGLKNITRTDLSTALRADPPPGRMLYLGHCVPPNTPTEPSTAGLLLYDRDRATDGARVAAERHLGQPDLLHALTPLDLFLGTPAKRDAQGLPLPGTEIPGHELWPMPPRVGLIACGSAEADSYNEALGLVAACVNAGAEYVTATRWTLPVDKHTGNATSALAMAVDDALLAPDPVAAVTEWQRQQLTNWLAKPETVANSPMLWASLQSFHAPTPDPQ